MFRKIQYKRANNNNNRKDFNENSNSYSARNLKSSQLQSNHLYDEINVEKKLLIAFVFLDQ